jgi:hypothetical protein
VDTVTVLRTVLSTTGLNLIKFKALAGVIIQTMPKGSKSVLCYWVLQGLVAAAMEQRAHVHTQVLGEGPLQLGKTSSS